MSPFLGLLVPALLAGVLAQVSAVSVRTRLGVIEGLERVTPRTGREYYAFTSVPYAVPPLGDRRLRNPLLHDGWTGTLDATKPAPICTQSGVFVAAYRNLTMGQEDCLYLNIFTPSINKEKKLPVLIYIHGGGFRCGKPLVGDEAPTNFMEEDVVLVTVHYRLGSLGFLSTESSEIPGNFGLKDQATAVKWVSKNIDEFGGDPSRITAFGESAGGASVHFLITSPLSRDLLQGSIAESGVIDAPWALAPPGRARRNARKLGELVGCNPDKNFLQCLQEVDAHKLIGAEKEFLVWDFDPAVVFPPVVEDENDGAFLTQDPRKIQITKPLITGIVSGEGIFKLASIVNQDESLIQEFSEKVDTILPELLFLEPDAPNLKDFIEVVKARYFKDISDPKNIYQGLDELYRDVFFIYPMHLALVRHEGPKYGYLFTHRAEHTLASAMGPVPVPDDRPSHGDELLSLFNVTSTQPESKGRIEDKELSIRLVRIWADFARTRIPSSGASEISWPQYKNNKILEIKTRNDHLITCPFLNVVEFWEKANQILQIPNIVKQEL